jgi:hypothetical protein
MTNLKPQAPLVVCKVVTTTPTSVSTSPSQFAADLAAKVLMRIRDLNRIFIAHVAPQELRSPNRPQVGTVSDPIPPQIGQTAASEIGAWPDSAAVKNPHRVAQALESAAANARINAEAPGLPQLHPPGLSPHLAPLCAAVVVLKDKLAFLKAALCDENPKMPPTPQALVNPLPQLR